MRFSKSPNFKAGLCIYNIWCWFKEFWTPDFQPQALTMNFPTLDFLNPKPMTWDVLGLWRASYWVCRTTTLWGSLRREASYKYAGWQCYHFHSLDIHASNNQQQTLTGGTHNISYLIVMNSFMQIEQHIFTSLINLSWHFCLIRGKPQRIQRVQPQVEKLMVEKFLFTSEMKSLGLKLELKCPATVWWL